jgi:hypothetical protein
MANDIGSVRGITGKSTELNTRGGQGCDKPVFAGSANPGGTKPEKPAEKSVPMPK